MSAPPPSTFLVVAALLVAVDAPAQVVEGAKKSAGEDSGPLSELSTNVRDGSRPVSEGSLTVREGSVGSMISGPTRDPGTRSMISGPVSEISRGPVTSSVPVTSGVSVRDASAGAVTFEAQRPVGMPLIEPDQELGALQEQLRLLREEAEWEAQLRESMGDSEPQPEGAPFDDASAAVGDEEALPTAPESDELERGEAPGEPAYGPPAD